MSSRLNTSVLGIVALTAFSSVMAAEGKSRAPRPVEVKIELTGRCNLVHVTVVFEGDEGHLTTRVKKDADGYFWTEWLDSRDRGRFPDNPICASLRLDGSRTYCRLSQRQKDDRDADVAFFSFDCDEREAQQVTIDAHPSIDFSYVRELKRSRKKSDPPEPLDCPCSEKAHFEERRTIPDLVFPSEKVLLQLGAWQPDSEAAGLLVFSEDPHVPGLFAFSADARNRGRLVAGPGIQKPAKNVDKGLSIRLERSEIVKQLFVQRSKNGDFSSPAIDIDEKALSKLTYVDITAVVK
jgi:hypothetical protein